MAKKWETVEVNFVNLEESLDLLKKNPGKVQYWETIELSAHKYPGYRLGDKIYAIGSPDKKIVDMDEWNEIVRALEHAPEMLTSLDDERVQYVRGVQRDRDDKYRKGLIGYKEFSSAVEVPF